MPRETELNDRLIEFAYQPDNERAAPIDLFVSENELVFCAGQGTRVELGAPADCVDELVELARSVAAGALQETVRGSRVHFVLELENGAKVSGTSAFRGARPPEYQGVIDYSPY